MATGNIGLIYHSTGDLEWVLEYYQKNLLICEEIGYRQGMSMASGHIGLVYLNRGDLNRALEFFQKDLAICEEIGDRRGVNGASNNIGLVFLDSGDLDRALDFFQKYLSISEEISYRQGISIAFGNIGLVYHNRGNLERALEYFQKTLNICKEIGDRFGIAEANLNLSETFRVKGDLVRALQLNNEANELFKELNSELNVGDCWCRKVDCNLDGGNSTAARDSLVKALVIYERHQAEGLRWRIPLLKVRLALIESKVAAKKGDYHKTGSVLVQAQKLVTIAEKSQRRAFKIEALILCGWASSLAFKTTEAKATLDKAINLAHRYRFGLLVREIKSLKNTIN